MNESRATAIAFLRSSEGAAALRAAADLDLRGSAFLRELTRLRRLLPPEQAAAVLEQVALRRRAATKFSRADEMLFTRDGLEQASGEAVAAHSAARYRGYAHVGDLCCGIGGDTLALARHARVGAYDIDAARLACAEHNAAIHGLESRIDFHCADVETLDLTSRPRSHPGKGGQVEAIFYDPGRRVDGRRIFSLAAYRPPVSLVERWLPAVPAIGVKVAPGVAHEKIVWECEQEFVAEGQELKEGLLWFGPLASTARRATVLPAGATLVAASSPSPPPGEPSGWLYDPSPAVTRAGLIWDLAALLGARQLDPALAYLTAPERVVTPFARAYWIDEWLPFNLKRLKTRLRELGVGRVNVRKRGSPLDPAALERQLRQPGAEERILVLTKLNGRPIAIICHDEGGNRSA